MATFRETREALLLAHDLEMINDKEFILLHEASTSKNLAIPYWKHDSFDLDSLTDDECKSEFRFHKNDIYSLLDVLDLPEKILCPNRFFVYSDEALCMLLKRFAYPLSLRRLGAKICKSSASDFHGGERSYGCYIYDNFGRLLCEFDQPWLAPAKLAEFADVVHWKEGALENCWGFIDGTVRPVCRPGINQRILYNGHKRVHAIKFQSVVSPNGLIANLFGPVEGRRHDSGMLAESGLLPKLERHCVSPTGVPLCVYGDPAYPLRVHLQAPFKGNLLTPMQQAFNESMSKVRVAVEWVFGDILQYFAFLDFKKDLKVGLSAIGKMYIVCALLRNDHTCKYGSSTSTFFGLDPPNIEDYFV